MPDTAPRDRLIFALDVPNLTEAERWIDRLGDSVTFYKIGLELCMSGDYFEVLDLLKARGKRIFADVKLSDIPATISGAVTNLAKRGVDFCTVHTTSAGYAAALSARGTMNILAVTVLTSIGPDDLAELGWPGTLEDLVLFRARRAIDSGVDGLICSGNEAARIRKELGNNPILVTPGIRAADARGTDDQKRTMTPTQALQAGADYLVVGRPIRDAAEPRAAADAIQEEIARFYTA